MMKPNRCRKVVFNAVNQAFPLSSKFVQIRYLLTICCMEGKAVLILEPVHQ